MVTKDLTPIFNRMPEIEKRLQQKKEVLLANLVMIGEIPAPTFGEEKRVAFILDRFDQAGLTESSTDEAGNGIGVLPGNDKRKKKSILVYAHTDTVFSEKIDHTIQIDPTSISGPGVADNSLGAALLTTLPWLLEELEIELGSDLVLLAGVKSLGRGDLQGIRFFLENNHFDIDKALCLEGVSLGRLSYSSIGMLRGEITCTVPETYDWSRFGDASSILTLNEVINKINDIRMPKRPRTSIVMGSIEGGSSFNTIARESTLKFEVRSESQQVVNEIGNRIEEIGIEVASRTGDHVHVDIFARRSPGGIDFSDSLIRTTRDIIRQLDIEPRLAPSLSELSAFIDKGLPALTLGLTTAEKLNKKNETILIEPVFKGITQIIATLLAIDGGYCD